MSRPWLSVLIPVYNVKDYLRECLVSVIEQIDGHVEILMVEDCSTDGSDLVLKALAAEFPDRFTVIQHERNQGLSAARNTMLEVARGDYLWFLDSDDKILPGAIAQLKSVVDRRAPDLVLCDFAMWRSPQKLKHRLRGEDHRRTFDGVSNQLLTDRAALLEGLFEQGHLHIWSKISKASLWRDGLRFPVGRYFEDMVVTPRLALRAASYYHASAVWVAYRQRQGSILASMSPKKLEDLSQAMVGYQELFRQQVSGAAGAEFALAYCAAKNFIGVARCLHSSNIPGADQLLVRYQHNFLISIPYSLERLRAEYLKRGWLWRWLRLRYWHHKALQKKRSLGLAQ